MKRNIKTILEEIEFNFSRSSGAGGQNVNKRDTKVEIRWKSKLSKYDPSIVSIIVDYFKINKPSLLNNDEEVIIFCQDTRSREHNKEIALDKFITLVYLALTPAEKRKPTKVSESKKKKRKIIKQMSSRKKRERRENKLNEI